MIQQNITPHPRMFTTEVKVVETMVPNILSAPNTAIKAYPIAVTTLRSVFSLSNEF